MSILANRWAGRLYGTNTGNIFFDMTHDGKSVSGRLRIMDSLFGVAIYDYTGTFDKKLLLECEPVQAAEGIELGKVVVRGVLTDEGNLKGDWESTIGTAGTFEAYPHGIDDPRAGIDSPSSPPEQIHNKTIPLGSIRLFKDDVLQLINFIKKDFSSGRVIVTYVQRGSELTKYADDFLNNLDGLDQLNYFKIVIQEPEAHGINRVIVVEFMAYGDSETRVSGINESWVLGKSESIFQLLKPKQNHLVTSYRKYGLNLNSAIFFGMLVVIPGLAGWTDRAIFVVAVFTLLNILLFAHNRFIPNTAIYIGQSRPNLFARIWPSLLSWFSAASSSFVAAYIFWYLTSGSS
ncbi:MAG: hypothetical protein D6160_20660 [Ketobacter sp.]|nr:MAG: hypothetical protein D6160_20660 [Ketobacter sp.]